MPVLRIGTVGEAAARSHRETARLYADGIVAGLLGATTVAAWFLIVDTIVARPFRTPSMLGAALFGEGGEPRISAGTVLLFTCVHALVFVILGGVAGRLLGVARRHPSFGFGILLLFVYLEGAYLVASFVFAWDVLRALAWPAVMVGNLLAAAVMAAWLRHRNPRLRIPA